MQNDVHIFRRLFTFHVTKKMTGVEILLIWIDNLDLLIKIVRMANCIEFAILKKKLLYLLSLFLCSNYKPLHRTVSEI